ncbi:MAG: PD40 domain-containing protein [Scytonematopsis contorta HA4267-MV1]|nr:PD40 domain-containing protein [Scytonematopsis contorta HA4267-MV1]
MTHAAYDEIGGIETAVVSYAEQVYAKLSEKEKEQARRIFLQLIRPGEGTDDTKRLALLTEVGLENRDLVTHLASNRLVVTGRDSTTELETVEIVHEALIREWERLRCWIEIDREFRIWQQGLRTLMHQWDANGRLEDGLLFGKVLTDAEDWLQKRTDELTAEQEYIKASLLAREKKQQQQERKRKQTIFSLASGLAGAIILASGAFWQWQQAEIRRVNAELNTMSADSKVLLNSNQELESLIEGVRAGRKLQSAIGVASDTKMRVVLALQEVVYGVRERNRFDGSKGDFSPDGKMLVTLNKNTIKIWDADGKNIITKITDGKNSFADVSFSPDSKILVTASNEGKIKLWSIDGRLLRTFNEQSLKIAFSFDGKMLASMREDGTVKLWKLDGTLLKTFKGQKVNDIGRVGATIIFSPDDTMLAAINSDGKMFYWNINGTLIKVVERVKGGRERDFREDQNTYIAFSPNSKILALVAPKGTNLFDRNGTLLKTIKNEYNPWINSVTFNQDSWINGVTFSPDGKTIALLHFGTVHLWSLEGKKIKTLKGDVTTGSSNLSKDTTIRLVMLALALMAK